jgi:hypothetical protein
MRDPASSRTLVFAHGAADAFPRDAEVIALTPVAYEAAIAAGVTPLVVDDVVERPAFFFDPTPYQRWQTSWLQRLDAAAPERAGAVLAAAQMIKVPVDSVVAHARLLQAVVDAHRPTEVVYVGSTADGGLQGMWHAGHIQFHPLLGDAPLASRLLPLIASAAGVPFRTIDVGAGTTAPAGMSLRQRVRRAVAPIAGPMRRLAGLSLARGRDTTLMLWYGGYGADAYASGEADAGRRVAYLSRGDTTARVVEPGLVSPLAVSRAVGNAPAWAAPAGVDLQPFLDEVDEWAGVAGAGDLLRDRLRFYVDAICPAVEAGALALGELLATRRVTKVAAANPSSIAELAALTWAAGNGVERVLCQHGDHLFGYDYWLITETHNFDTFLVSDPTVIDELHERAGVYGVRLPDMRVGSPRLASATPPPRRHDGPLVYVPAFFMGDSYVVGASYLEDAWYHRWHLRLLDLLGHTGLDVVWKALPASDQSHDPIDGIIRARAPGNVRYDARPFRDVLPSAGRVLIDFASTALYETAMAGVPVLALNFPRFTSVRPEARAMFEPVVRDCASVDDALRETAAFLADDPANWVVSGLAARTRRTGSR